LLIFLSFSSQNTQIVQLTDFQAEESFSSDLPFGGNELMALGEDQELFLVLTLQDVVRQQEDDDDGAPTRFVRQSPQRPSTIGSSPPFASPVGHPGSPGGDYFAALHAAKNDPQAMMNLLMRQQQIIAAQQVQSSPPLMSPPQQRVLSPASNYGTPEEDTTMGGTTSKRVRRDNDNN
jgi:hypothetical protein